jgi:GNAT superfamily N-acetyltransferase
MSSRTEIELAQPSDIEALSLVIALSFHSLAPSVWLIADPVVRTEVFPGYFQLYVEEAMERGHVYTTKDRTAVALWLPNPDPGSASASDSTYDARLAAATGNRVEQFRAFDALLEKHHPTGIRHDHLAILAVHPDHQRQGLGTDLLAAHHRRLDESDPPIHAYLEASDAGTRTIYLKHGYADLGDPIQLPDGPQMFPMMRPAAADQEP